jgi:DNA-binding transcriptional regulator YiaG
MHHAHPPTVEPLTSDVNVDVTEADIADAQRYAYEIWWSDEDSAYLGRAEEMPGTMSHGDTPEEALSMTIEAQALALVAMRHWNRYVPPPREKVSVVTIRELVFATALGVDAGTVRSWEQGTRNVSGAARRLIQAIDTRPHILAEWAVERR